MLPINARCYRLTDFIFAIALVSTISVSHAEWIKAQSIGASNHIWINTERDALYAGDSCSPLMTLKHMSGNKPRSLRQRQQIYIKRSGINKNADQKVELGVTQHLIRANKPNSHSAVVGDDHQVARARLSPLDPLNLNYQTQPDFDPLNRNQFNIAISDSSITLISQYSRITARISGRYNRRPECGS